MSLPSSLKYVIQMVARALVTLASACTALFILYPIDALETILKGTATPRVNGVALVLVILALVIINYSWKFTQRLWPVIVGAPVLAYLMQDVPRTWALVRVSILSLALAVVVWSLTLKLREIKSLQKFTLLAVNPWWVVALVSGMYIFISLAHHYSFNFTGFDLGIFTQEVYKYANLEGIYNTVKDQNIFADHFSPFLILLAPLWWIWPSASMLLVVQVLALTIAGWVTYKITYHLFQDKLISWCVATAYLLAPSVQGPLETDFHEAVFVPLALLLLYYFQLKERYMGYWITFGLALLIKEDVALFLLAWSVFYGLTTKRWRQATIGILISALYFVLVVKVIMPLYTGKSSYQYFQMGPLGESPADVAKTAVTNPWLVVKQFFTFDTTKHALFPPDTKLFTQLSLLASFGFLPLLAPITLIMAAPMLAEQFLIDRPYHWGLFFHYATPLTAVLVIATLITLLRIPTHLARFNQTKHMNSRMLQQFLAIFLVISAITYTVSQRTFSVNMVRKQTYTFDEHMRGAHQIIKLIPPKASVATKAALLPHVAGRNVVFTWPGWWGESGAVGYKNKPLNTDYALLSYVGYQFVWTPEETVKHMDQAIHTPGYGLVAISDDGWTILVKKDAESNPDLLKRWEQIRPTLVR